MYGNSLILTKITKKCIIIKSKEHKMTTLLETAFKKASSLSEREQNIYARIFIEEIESEKKWDSVFSSSEDLLARMADNALEDFKNNDTKTLD